MRPFAFPVALGAAALACSLCAPLQAATPVGARVGPLTPIEFTVALPLRNEAELDRLIALQGDESSPIYHHYLSPEQFAVRYGPTPAAFNLVAGALRSRGLAVGNFETQTFDVRGTAAQVERAFGIRLEPALRRDQASIVVRTPLQMPAELRAAGATILRLDAMPLPRPDSVRIPLNRSAADGPYWFTDLKEAYHDDSYLVARGAGATIATLGDSDFSSSDAALYFKHDGLYTGTGSKGPAPVPAHLLLSGYSKFNPDSDASFEANLDVQMAAGAAPGATVTGVSVGANNFLDAYSVLVKANKYDIISTSYGGCELLYTAAYNGGTSYVNQLQAFSNVFKQGNSQGITFVFSSGDSSGLPCPQLAYFGAGTGKSYKNVAAVDFWADDPNVTGVGGTNLITSYTKGSLASTYVSESEYYDFIGKEDPYSTGNYVSNAIWGSGGGVSVVWPKPSYQTKFTTTKMRSVPDVAMDMGGCLQPSWKCNVDNKPGTSALVVVIGGEFDGAGGTSASAPAFAGLLAVKVAEGKARLGNANTYIYGLAAANATGNYFHEGIPGSDDVVAVDKGKTGYNVITGVGTPIGTNFLKTPTAAFAETPGSPSNP
jgi:subtilase family serine protease